MTTGEILAIDIGSTAVKAGVFGVDGDPVGGVATVRHRQADSADPPGQVRVEGLLDATVRAVRQLDLESVRVVATSTIWHACVAVDAAGDPIGPALSWEATMPIEVRGHLEAKLGSAWTHRDSGAYLHPSFSLVSIPVLAERHPHRISDLGSWIVGRLAGSTQAWPENIAAGSGLWLQQQRGWNLPAFDALGVNPALVGDQWSQPVRACTPLAEQLRGAWFLPPVGDGLCHNIGQHAVDRRIAITVGTSGSVRAVTDGPDFDGPGDGLWRYRCAEQTVATGGAITSAGNTFEWVADLFGAPIAWEALTPDLVHTLPVGDSSIFGRRGPDYPWDAAGSISGIRPGTRAEHIGLAWGLDVWRRAAEHLGALRRVNSGELEIVVEGGALGANPPAAQALADALGVPIFRTAQLQPSLAGAALLGATTHRTGGFGIDSTVEAIRTERFRRPAVTAGFHPRQQITDALHRKWAAA